MNEERIWRWVLVAVLAWVAWEIRGLELDFNAPNVYFPDRELQNIRSAIEALRF